MSMKKVFLLTLKWTDEVEAPWYYLYLYIYE